MRAFVCDHCGLLLFFENSLCLRCGTPQGFVPSRLDLATLEPGSEDERTLRRCANAVIAECNWMVDPDEPGDLCLSCRLTRTRPNDADAQGMAAFAKTEGAKRRVVAVPSTVRVVRGGSVGSAWSSHVITHSPMGVPCIRLVR